MTEVFADTYYWLALLNRKDPYHAKVSAYEYEGSLVTHWGIAVEVFDALAQPNWRIGAMQFWSEVHAEPDVVLLPLDEALLERAVSLYSQRPDKGWSLTDCVSFIVMRDRGIALALTGDHHFEQAGFQIAFK